MVDKNLFLYDLAVVAIMKGEEPYVKEWIDYHILAGVDHFYIYDNDSTPDFKKILQPYIDSNIVTYIHYPGKARQYEAYNDAFKSFKFECRYMAIIDGDEFIFPKSKSTIVEVVDEVLGKNQNAAALGANWQMYGSNNLETAEFSRGVLDRFTKRSNNVDKHTKTIADPRKIDFFQNSHYAIYFQGNFSVNENGRIFAGPFNEEKTVEKICINHYHTKSYEEYVMKRSRGDVISFNGKKYGDRLFKTNDKNDVLDDGIIKYRDARCDALIGKGVGIESLVSDNESRCEKVFKALTSTLLPAFNEDDPLEFFDNPKRRYEYFNLLVKFMEMAPQDFFKGKLETYLTCFAVSSYLKENFLDEYFGELFEEFSLNAALKSFQVGVKASEIQLLIKTLPTILSTPYPVTQEFRASLKIILPKFMNQSCFYREGTWKDFVHYDYLLQMLEVFDKYDFKPNSNVN